MERALKLPHLTEPHERLKWARSRRFKTPADAADWFGFNQNTYKSIENGVRGMTRKKAELYGAKFGISPAWLLTGLGDVEHPVTVEEAMFLEMFRILREHERDGIIAMMQRLLPQAGRRAG